MSNFIHVTPFLHVPDIRAAIAFFTDILGFRVEFRLPDYAYVERESVGFRLLEAGHIDRPLTGDRRFRHYIDVRDVDALYAELKPALDTLPPGDVHGPETKAYGQRELLVLAPDGDLIAFGQAVSPS